MTFGVESADAMGSLRLIGELDLAVVPEAESALAARWSASAPLVLDLSGLTFIDSSGVRLLLRIWAERDADGLETTLVRPTGMVQRVFDILELEEHGVRIVTDPDPSAD